MPFIAGDRVKVINGVHNVRSAPDSTLPYSPIPQDSQGVVTDGPMPDASGNWVGTQFYRVNWDLASLPDGWMVEGNLGLVSPAPGEIGGHIRDAAGAPISGADVSVPGNAVVSEIDGTYHIVGLPVGDYIVSAAKDGFTGQDKPVTVVTGTTMIVDFDLQPVVITIPRGTIAGRVQDPMGIAIQGASVSVPDVPAVLTNANGEYIIDGLQAAGDYLVSVSKTGYGPEDHTVPVVTGQTTPNNFTLYNPVVPVGGLTTAEFTSIQNLIWAMYGNKAGDVGSVHDGIGAALGIITRDETKSTTRAALANLWRLCVKAQNDIALALGDLLGGSVLPTGMPRQFYTDRAKGLIATTRTQTLPQAQAACDAAIAAGVTNTFQMGRMKTLHLQGAINKLALFNASLAFSNPYPLGRAGTAPHVRITIIGPHGDYIRCQTWLNTAFDRLNRMYTAAIDGYAADALLSGYNNKYQQFKFCSLLVQKVGTTAGTVAGLQFSGYSSDPFFRILSIFENLTHGGGGPTVADNDCAPDFCHGASYDFNNMKIWTQGDAGQESTRPTFKAKQALVLSEVTESWQATDTAAWYMLKFPECEVTGGCGGK